MSLDNANHLFAQLHAGGLEPERDFGLVDMAMGVLIPCDDVKVIETASGGIGLPPPRFVELCQEHRHVPRGLEMTWQRAGPLVLP